MEKQRFKQLLTVDEVAKILAISPRSIYNMTCRKAKKKFPIKPLRIGKCIRFDIDDINKYLISLKKKLKSPENGNRNLQVELS